MLNTFFFQQPSPLSFCHGILSLVVVAIRKLPQLKGNTIIVVIHNTGVSSHHIVLPMLGALGTKAFP